MFVTSASQLKTPSNIITIARILLVPVFVAALLSPWPSFFGFHHVHAWQSWVAAGIFILVSATDWLDGYLARKRNEVTDFGKFLDPLADKILVMAALIALVELGSLPSWVVLVILARDFIVSAVRMVAANMGEVIAASWFGKFKTVAQMAAIVLFVIAQGAPFGESAFVFPEPFFMISWLVMLLAVALTIGSMVDYLSKARHLLGFRPKEGVQPHKSIEYYAKTIVEKATEKQVHIGCAESITGGLIAGAISDIPGASAVLRGGVVSYTNEVKISQLGVDAHILSQRGAVDEDVARQMAAGVRDALHVDVAVAVTGLAGPDGGTPDVPVGTVWVGVATTHGVEAYKLELQGTRDDIRNATVREALRLVDEKLSE
ncbi:MAG: CDP-diacylglycerol--glycerol-3-phosphate 3-phosphatidyltransferase [Eggerthellaceae bacterium]|nr:CDP-diacylglycerol--glycerol-3-phosphate 3-phosphatidyltransferase [Eggerthellaceae bacterium]